MVIIIDDFETGMVIISGDFADWNGYYKWGLWGLEWL